MDLPSHVATVTAERVAQGRDRVLTELRKIIVGQDEVVDQVLLALFTGGHCLITGVPGLAKTLLIKTLAEILDLDFVDRHVLSNTAAWPRRSWSAPSPRRST